jgi:Zn-dependent protease with chaperone function
MEAKPSTGTYLISAHEIAPGWVLLYAVTFALQFVVAAIRALVAYVALWLIFTAFGESTALAYPLSLVIGYAPLALSFATLILPLGGWIWQTSLGGRSPSGREQLIFDDAMALLAQASSQLRPPRRWFVLDEPHVNAAAYADTLMLTRGLLESGQLAPVLAHELGHLNSSDARLTAALHRLTTPPRRRISFPLRTIGLIASGAIPAMLTRVPWGAYWRAREFHADAYAGGLGQGAALARFLDQNALEFDLPIPFMWLTDTSHPWTEHRIDRLCELEVGE